MPTLKSVHGPPFPVYHKFAKQQLISSPSLQQSQEITDAIHREIGHPGTSDVTYKLTSSHIQD
jgi:hypothetical protein